jgi:4-hydroxyphenylacetate 3-monooxygenase
MTMLISGAEKLRRMRDGRAIRIGSERVGDVTAHPAFAGGARSVAEFYDVKASPEHGGDLTYAENGVRHSIWWLRPRNRDDLSHRMRGSKALADLSFGFFGRSPDHIGSLVTGLAMPLVLEKLRTGCGENLIRYYERARDEDIYLTYAVTPPSGLRSNEATPGSRPTHPSLRVVREEDDGVVISGMKMLATAAVYADDIWIGNLQPLEESRLAESITCAIPIATPGLSLWARQPYALNVRDPRDYPVSYRFDESDCVLVCEEALGAHFPAQQRIKIAGDLSRNAGELFGEPSVELSVLVQDVVDRRPRQPYLHGQRRGKDTGSAGATRPPCGAGGHDRRPCARPSRRLRVLA